MTTSLVHAWSSLILSVILYFNGGLTPLDMGLALLSGVYFYIYNKECRIINKMLGDKQQ